MNWLKQHYRDGLTPLGRVVFYTIWAGAVTLIALTLSGVVR